MKDFTIEKRGLTWRSIVDPTFRHMEKIGADYDFHILDIKDSVSKRQIPKIEVYRKYLFAVLHFPEYDDNKDMVVTREVDFFIGKNFVVTSRRGAFTGMKTMEKLLESDGKLMSSSTRRKPAYAFYVAINQLYNNGFSILDKIGKQINETEQKIFAKHGSQNEEAVHDLSNLRRNVLRLARIIEPQLRITKQMQKVSTRYWLKDAQIYFDDIDDHLEKMWVIIQAYEKQLDSLYQTNETLIGHRTNRIVMMLTVFSVTFLPMTLIASMYGMNVEYLPLRGHPFVFWGIVIFTVILITATFLVLRRRRWF
ncbi:magnesium transporter CorA family protein [Patescibacteria group bacterium]